MLLLILSAACPTATRGQERPLVGAQVWIEPGQRPAPDPLAVRRYGAWPKEKYGSVARLNAAWPTDYDSFERVAYDPRWAAGGFAFTAPAADGQTIPLGARQTTVLLWR